MCLAIMVFIFMIGLGGRVIVWVVVSLMLMMMSMRLCVGQHAGQNLGCAMVVQRFMGKRVGHT
jgi:hypothetical protein